MSPRQQQAPIQSLPSFAHTFPDIAARTSHSTSTSPQPPRAGSKRRHDTLDDGPPTNPPPSPGSHSRRHKRLKSPPRPPPRSNGHPPQLSSPPDASRSSSVSQDAVIVKEEDQDDDRDPSPPRPPAPAAPQAQAAASYPLLEPLSRNKRRRVTISGAHLQPVPAAASRSPHHPVSVRASPNLSPLTPTVSPAVMGFTVPKTPQGIPHRSSVDQVRSALSLKQQQKALIEARRSNPNASLPLPTPPVTGGSSAGSAGVAPVSAGGESVSVSALGEGSHTDVLPQIKARTRSRAVTVTTGMALSGMPSRGGAGDYIRESTRASIAERHAEESALRSTRQEPSPPVPPSRAVDRDGDVSMRPSSPRLTVVPPPPALSRSTSSHSHVDTPPPQDRHHPLASTSIQPPLLSPSENLGASSLLVRRRGIGGSNLGVNTSGISNAGSSVNTGASSSIPPSAAVEEEANPASGRRSGPSRTPVLTVRTTNIDPPRSQASELPARPHNAVEDAPPPLAPAANNNGGVVRPPQFHPAGTGTLVNVPGKPFRAQGRNPLLNLDPVIRSAPLTVGGRMIINGRPPVGLRNDWGREDRLPPLSSSQNANASEVVGRSNHQRMSTAPQTPVDRVRPPASSPTQLTSKHHSQLFPTSSQVPVRSQVPISTTLRTPHVANFTIPTRQPVPAVAAAAGANGIPAVANAGADKQGFLGLFGQFYDSLNDAKHLKSWLEGQAAKSDGLIAKLELVVKEMEVDRAKVRQEATEEVVRLRSRVQELEERLARLERGPPEFPRMEVDHRYDVTPRREYDIGRRDRMDVDRESEQERGSSGSSPVLQRRPYDYPPPPTIAPLQPYDNSRRDRAPMPLPPIATLGNGIEPRDEGRRSRRGSVVGLPPPPPGGRSRRESFSNVHPPAGLHPHSHSRNSSISPPQHPSLPPIGPPPGRSPNEPHRLQAPQRSSPLANHLPPPSGPSRQRSPYPPPPHRLHVVARPTPTPSPPPHAHHHRLVARVSDI